MSGRPVTCTDAGQTYAIVVPPLQLGDVETALRAKTIKMHNLIAPDDSFVTPDILTTLIFTGGCMRPAQAGQMASLYQLALKLRPTYVCYPCTDPNEQYVVVRANIAYYLMSRLFAQLRTRTVGVKGGLALAPELQSLLAIVSPSVPGPVAHTPRHRRISATGPMSHEESVASAESAIVVIGIMIYQLRSFISNHRRLLDIIKMGVRPEMIDGGYRSLWARFYVYHPCQFASDYPLYATTPPDELVPLYEVLTPLNSPTLLYASVKQYLDEESLVACLPLRQVIHAVIKWRHECPSKFDEIRLLARSWYNRTISISVGDADEIGVIATAVYYAVQKLTTIYGHIRAHPLPTYPASSPLVLQYNVELIQFAVWLRMVNYWNIVAVFEREAMLADNVVSAYDVDSAACFTLNEQTIPVDTTAILKLDPAYAPFCAKTDPIKQLMKTSRPKKNFIRSIDSGITETIMRNTQQGGQVQRDWYSCWILGMVVCSLTGGWRHAKERVDFQHAYRIYQYFSDCTPARLIAFVSRISQPIRCIMKEYLCYLIQWTPECIEQNGINYSVYRHGTLGNCDYMRWIIGNVVVVHDITDFVPAINAGINSVNSSKQIEEKLRDVCGTRYRELRKLQHPLISEPKCEYSEFLAKAVHTVLQQSVVQYMITHECAELLHRVIVAATADAPSAYQQKSMAFAIDGLNRYHGYNLTTASVSGELNRLTHDRDHLLHTMQPGELLYVLSGNEQADIFELVCSLGSRCRSSVVGEYITHYVQRTSVSDALVQIYNKHVVGSSDKSVISIVKQAFSPRELAIFHYTLRIRRIMSHRLIPQPPAVSDEVELAMIAHRLGCRTAVVPAMRYNIYYAPCCPRDTSVAEKGRVGNDDVVYNPFNCHYQCGRAARSECKSDIGASLFPPHFSGLTPFVATISSSPKNPRNKNARLVIRNYYQLPCCRTPVFPISLRDCRISFSDADGNYSVSYFCPTCARLTKVDIMSYSTTFSSCAICERESLHFVSWDTCHRCHNIISSNQLVTVLDDAAVVRYCRSCADRYSIVDVGAHAHAVNVCIRNRDAVNISITH